MTGKETGTLAFSPLAGAPPGRMAAATPRTHYALKISLIYVALAALWLVMTDGLPIAFYDVGALGLADAVEDVSFLIVTAALLYAALQKCPSGANASPWPGLAMGETAGPPGIPTASPA